MDDDVVMMFLADGTSYGEPLPDLVFINVGLGLVLQVLYNVVPALPWYGLLLYSFHVAAFATLLYLIFTHPRLRLWIHLPALAAVTGVYVLYTWMDLQFTSVTMLLATAAMMLYLLKAYRPETSVWTIVLAAFMLGSASILRWTAWAGVVGLSLPLLAFTVTRVPWRRQVLFAGVALAITLGAGGFQSLYYAGDEEWTAWNEFNDVRGDLHTTSRLDSAGRDRALLAEIGWERNDFEMFRTWFYMDEELFSTEALDTIMANTELTTGTDISRSIDPLFDSRWPQTRLVLMATLFIAGIVVASRRERWMLTAGVAWTVAISAFTIVFIRFPERVAVPVLAFAAIMLLLIPGSQDPPRPGSRVSKRISLAAMLLLVAVSIGAMVNTVVWVVPWSRDNADRQVRLQTAYQSLDYLDPDGTFVTWTSVMENNRITPLSQGIVADPVIIPLGWQARAPFHLDHIENLGVEDIHVSIAADPDVYLVSAFQQNHQAVLATYLRSHYGYEGLLRPVARFGQLGRIAVFDAIASYRVQGDRLIETTGGGALGYPLVATGGRYGGTVEQHPLTHGGNLRGWTADTTTGRVADLIVVLDEDRTIHLSVPFETRPGIAAEIGIPTDSRLGFSSMVPGAASDTARVFAIFGDKAVELLPQNS